MSLDAQRGVLERETPRPRAPPLTVPLQKGYTTMAGKTTAAPSTELEVRRQAEMARLDELETILLTGEIEDEQEVDEETRKVQAAEMYRAILAEILSAESDQGVQRNSEATGWASLEGVPIELHDFHWQRSTFDGDGPPIYFVVTGHRLDEGESVVLTTGSATIMAQLVNLKKRGTLAGSVWKLVKGEKTRGNFVPLHLEQLKPPPDAA